MKSEEKKVDAVTTPEPKPAPALAPAIDAIVEDWFVATFFNRPLPEGLYNHVYAEKLKLKDRLSAALSGKV